METILMTRTKSGNGLKINVDGRWLFASKSRVQNVLDGHRKGVSFDVLTSVEQDHSLEELVEGEGGNIRVPAHETKPIEAR